MRGRSQTPEGKDARVVTPESRPQSPVHGKRRRGADENWDSLHATPPKRKRSRDRNDRFRDSEKGHREETLVIGVFQVGASTVPINETIEVPSSGEVDLEEVDPRDDDPLIGRDLGTEIVEISRDRDERNPNPKTSLPNCRTRLFSQR